jgi:EAL domain-containing protein (putative c-di-GMP-specific phosphodiesterase class I)/CheY-like chemotaxis protein
LPAAIEDIFIVDDDPVFGAVAEMLLFSLGANSVRQIDNTREALAALAKSGSPSSLVIVNLAMRGLDGLAVLRELSNAHFPGWIAISTGESHSIRDSASRLAGLLGLKYAGEIQKPLREGEIRALFETISRDEKISAQTPVQPFRNAKIIGLCPVYQPKIDALTGETIGAETLMRLETAEGDLLSPFQHIERLTREGKMTEETLRFLDLVLADIVEWKAGGLNPVISFNAPAPVIEHPEFLVDFARKVRTSGVSPSQITIELTESVLPNDPATLVETLTRLRMAGFGLALDDFGTGMANFDMLRMCPFSELKVDRSLAQTCVIDPLSCGIIETCATVSRELGMTLVAEGVETEAQELTLRRLGVEVFQGFLFGKGVPAAEFSARLGAEGLGHGGVFADARR